MKIDSAVKLFFEKYDRDAMQSIDNISKEHGLVVHGSTIKAFNLTESFNIFNNYLRGYTSYKIDTVGQPEEKTLEQIKESVKKFIDNNIFKESEVKYTDLPSFVSGYVNGVNSLIETVDEIKRTMTDADVKQEDIGAINEFTDMFMDKFHESFDSTMETILWASGYNGRKKLFAPNTNRPKAPVFL